LAVSVVERVEVHSEEVVMHLMAREIGSEFLKGIPPISLPVLGRERNGILGEMPRLDLGTEIGKNEPIVLQKRLKGRVA
jgi:hypothetical protein